MAQLRLALAQADFTVGDLPANSEKVVALTHEAAAKGAHLVVFPEMALTGYPIEDLALRASFVAASRNAVEGLAVRLADEGLGDLTVIVGYLGQHDDQRAELGRPKGAPHNSAAVLHGGRVVTSYAKHHLPNYGVFDEFRYFVPGDTMQVVRVHGIDIALCICEDLWRDGPVTTARSANAGLLVVINGSPYERNKDDVRLELCAKGAAEAGCPLAYVNLVGGQDELVFDGDSIVVSPQGDVLARAPQFDETLLLADLALEAADPQASVAPESDYSGLRVEGTVVSREPVPAYDAMESTVAERLDDSAEIYQALVVGLRDYVRKNGFRSVLMGLSGGIDSSLTAVVACEAIGAENVYGVSNPSDYSSQHSKDDAAELARRTGLNFEAVPIAPIVEQFHKAVSLDGIAAENLQARIRAVIWMGLSNQHGHLVLACGNKSELAVGYSTIYGDAVGGFAPLKDLLKTQVWELARWRNAEAVGRGETPPIPQGVIDKPPSAELSPGQLDSDTLPDYGLLDDVLDDYIEHDRGSAELVQDGFDRELVERVLRMVDRAEYKRRQYPPGPKISIRNFGRDRRLPVTNAWREIAEG
ncbi:MAG: NAD+ synthase [Propionibacteriales bacterium]|nr:NAD+ synthase [Propionibacteriales bacterium]